MNSAWPSPGSIWGYGTDKRRADSASADLAYLIELLAQHSSATKINLLAYSAGGRVVGRALEQLGRYLGHGVDGEELLIAWLTPRLCHIDPAIGFADPAENHMHLVDVSRVQVSKKSEQFPFYLRGGKCPGFSDDGAHRQCP